jgi:hypothetical protein
MRMSADLTGGLLSWKPVDDTSQDVSHELASGVRFDTVKCGRRGALRLLG